MKYSLTGSCPRCGAPIFAVTELLAAETGGRVSTTGVGKPTAHFTCNCREFLPQIPSGDLDQPRSVSEGDVKFVTDARAAERESARRG